MWLNEQQISAEAVRGYRQQLKHSCPRHLVLDNLFDPQKLQAVSRVLQRSAHWQTQQHSYAALYVDAMQWQQTPQTERFVQRDLWQRPSAVDGGCDSASDEDNADQLALAFLQFLRSETFLALLSRIFRVQLTDIHVAKPTVNTNYFRLSAADFVNLHADDSPGREVCMLLYLNEDWQSGAGGELMFAADGNSPVAIAPLFNRCVLFDPASQGAEHWVNAVSSALPGQYRYNVTSWYWTE
jgi:Rps23 Pro-64 3,4-dihydroxylase Tpa1-like proline 4-hydroxylase